MGHILGLGSQWAEAGVVQYDEVTGEYAYVGANAINVWKNVWQCESAAPPIETDGGEGTAGLHWDESCMQNEVSYVSRCFKRSLVSFHLTFFF